MISYVYISQEEELPEVSDFAPFSVTLILRGNVSSEWRYQIIDWLMRSGCESVYKWGADSNIWDNSIKWSVADDNSAGRFTSTYNERTQNQLLIEVLESF